MGGRFAFGLAAQEFFCTAIIGSAFGLWVAMLIAVYTCQKVRGPRYRKHFEYYVAHGRDGDANGNIVPIGIDDSKEADLVRTDRTQQTSATASAPASGTPLMKR
ncbi:hypothetical protein AAVH_08771 [Aphelenchoides avenae]|nr:hypothetical protein AAVH_08771 [Aphelenchus avenae]